MVGYDFELQPLRIPGGWTVMWNEFLDVDITQFPPDEALWSNCTEDMFYIVKNSNSKSSDTPEYAIDLGWYPEMEPDGAYILLVIKNGDWDNPKERFRSQNKDEVAKKIEEFLRKY